MKEFEEQKMERCHGLSPNINSEHSGRDDACLIILKSKASQLLIFAIG